MELDIINSGHEIVGVSKTFQNPKCLGRLIVDKSNIPEIGLYCIFTHI